jgi:hypothetical protein
MEPNSAKTCERECEHSCQGVRRAFLLPKRHDTPQSHATATASTKMALARKREPGQRVRRRDPACYGPHPSTASYLAEVVGSQSPGKPAHEKLQRIILLHGQAKDGLGGGLEIRREHRVTSPHAPSHTYPNHAPSDAARRYGHSPRSSDAEQPVQPDIVLCGGSRLLWRARRYAPPLGRCAGILRERQRQFSHDGERESGRERFIT